ncbi:MAG: ABC transporter permease subunit [Angustibacter sp.]
MTTQVKDSNPAQRQRVGPVGAVTFPRLVLSEFTKLRTVRSTMWTLGVAVLCVVGMGPLLSLAVTNAPEGAVPEGNAADGLGVALAGIFLAQLAMTVLGALSVTGEYSKGGMRTTLTAAPKRILVLLAKASVFGVVALVVGTLSSLLAVLLTAGVFSGADMGFSVVDGEAPRIILGGGLYLLGVGMFGFAFGVLLRHSAGAITAAVAAILLVPLVVLPLLLAFLDQDWLETLTKYFTTMAGAQVLNPSSMIDPGSIGMWGNYLIFTAQWVAVLVIGAVLFVKRDA